MRLRFLSLLLAACGGEPAVVDAEPVEPTAGSSEEQPAPRAADAPGSEATEEPDPAELEGSASDTGAALTQAAESGAPAAPSGGGEAGQAAAIVQAVLSPSPERLQEYRAIESKGVSSLQMFRDRRLASSAADGRPEVWLTDLNPVVHEWFLLEVLGPKGPVTYHLENTAPQRVQVRAAPEYLDGIVLEVDGVERSCALWAPDGPAVLQVARTSGRAYAPICEGRLSVRNPVDGRRSNLEVTTDFLRDNVWGGEKITAFVRETVYQDSELVTSEVLAGKRAAARTDGPAPFQVDPKLAGRRLRPVNLGLPLQDTADGTVEIGRWYPLEGFPGLFASTVQPKLADPALFTTWGSSVHPLDEVESTALVYVVAVDLDTHELRFDVGTDHPRVGWSERAKPSVVDSRLPGPDGFDTLSPLVRTGKVNPAQVGSLVATFTGGFKRSHAAFKAGDRATRDSGSHYGWVEHGVVESKLIDGLATVVGWADGEVEVLVWGPEQAERLAQVEFARQNGVPLVVPGAVAGEAVPGDLVTSWTAGNWSGSAEGKLRSVRASLCVQDSDRGRYLLYAYFSSATPSSMARVLAAYGCTTAMLTDMNALEHTYLSLHRLHGGVYDVHHLIDGMDVLDKQVNGIYLPRFVGLADNRDFFTVLRRPED